MSAPIHKTQNWISADYDMVIDVRSPAEFADDHIPGAVNMPVMSNDERAEVGTLYKQQSAFIARKRGAAIAARNIASHIDSVLSDKPAGFTPLIHCWRGGQRSRAFAHICSEIGWPCYLLDGGYKYYRRAVLTGLETFPQNLTFIMISGRTGNAKTALLSELAGHGAQILDLEKAAAHRGSLLGALPDAPQPSQRLFESHLYQQLHGLSSKKPVFVESESSRIGELQIPRDIWKKMATACQITIDTPRPARAAFLMAGYDHLMRDETAIKKLIGGMGLRLGVDRMAYWRSLLDGKDWTTLAMDILEHHYDPAYDRSVSKHNRDQIAIITQEDCGAASLMKTATQIFSLTAEINKNMVSDGVAR